MDKLLLKINVPNEYKHCDFFVTAVWWDSKEKKNKSQKLVVDKEEWLNEKPPKGDENSGGYRR